MEVNQIDRLPCGKPKPPIERAGAPVKDLTLTTWLLRSHFQQVKEHWRQCHVYYMAHQPTPAQLDYDNRFKPTDIDKALEKVKFPPSTGSVLVVIQGIRDFEGQFVRAMKGVSQACVLYAKLLLHGVYIDLEKLQSKKTATERQALVFDKENVEEQFMQTLESRVHAWLADHVPRDIQTKAANRTNTLSARMLIVEYYYTAIPGPDTIGMNMSKSIRVPTNTATTGVEVLANIESWKTSIQINHEVTQTMPSQQEIRVAFQRLISPLKVADEGFKFHQDLLVSQAFGTQKISDEDVLKYFQQTEEKIHSMDTRKQLKFPDRSPPSKTNAINTPDNTQKPKGKGNSRAQSVPPPKTGQQQKGSAQKKGEKGAGKSSEGRSQPKPTAPSKPSPPSSAVNPSTPKPGGGNTPNRTEKRSPGTIKKQCVPYTLPSGCVNGNNCPFQHANDPVTKKPIAPSPEDVKRYQAALKRNPSLADPKAASSSGTNKPSSSVPTIKMIRVGTPEESEEEPEPEQPAQVTESPPIRPRPPGNHPNPEGPIDIDELAQQFSRPGYTDPVCRHMRSRSMFADIIFGGNQHGRWLNCRHCDVRGAIQTLSLMSCVNCSLAHIYRPENDRRRTCVWTNWLRMIARYRFRMTDPEKAVIRERILRCQERRRMIAMGIHPPLGEPQAPEEPPQPPGSLHSLSNSELWERACQEERLSLLAMRASQTFPEERVSSSSGSNQAPPREVIDASHISATSPNVVTTRRWRDQTLPRGQAFQIDRLTGRTRIIGTGDFIPEADEDPESAEPEEDHSVSAVSVGAVRTTGSEDHYCMLDSGANVMVIPWKEGMEGDHTMCALVGDNKTEGLVVARLGTRLRTHLIVAVKGAKPLIPISYLIRIAHYRATWRMMGEHDCFQMKDGYGDPVMVNEDEDLLYVGKTTLWRIGHDLYNSALHTTGMTWSEVWKTLTGEDAPIRSIFAIQAQTNVDFVELYNPGNFTANKGELLAGTVIDCKVNPQFDLTSSQVRQEVATLIEKEDPLFLIGAPPCTVFSSMQNINQRHHVGEAWEVKYQQGLSHLEYAVQLYWEQISRGRFFLHEHPATATSWGLSLIKELERYPGVQIVTGDMCRWGMTLEKDTTGDEPVRLVKKPTKWMTNSPILAKLLQARCNGQHEHERLEGSSRTKQAESYPVSLVKAILNKVHQTKRMKMDANMAKDPLHMQIPAMFWQCEDNIKVSCTRKSMSRYDINPPIDVSWDSVLVRRTIDRKTGVVMAEDVRCSMDQTQLHRTFKGEVPKEVLTVFFSWEETPIFHAMSVVTSPGDRTRYDAISGELLQQYSQNIRLIPRSTYRKAIGEGVRTITYGAHTSNAASGKSGKHVTLITESVIHGPTLTLCHRLATTMPKPFPYLSITVVLLTDGEELSPHKDVQNHRLHQNATISMGEWKGGVLQTLEDDKWINCDSKDRWVFLNARETFHRVTEVTGYRLSIIYHTPQHLYRLSSEDWDTLRDAGFPVDLVWEQGMTTQDESDDDSECSHKVNEVAQLVDTPKTLSRQTSAEEMQGPLMELDDSLDIPWSSLRPTMQAILWLSDLVARYQLRPDVIPGANPKLHKATTTLELRELDIHLQRAKQAPMELTVILMCMANIILIALRLAVKLGAQCQLGVLILHLTKPTQDVGEDLSPEVSTGICRAIAMIPTKSLWKWVPNIHSLISLRPRPSKC